MLGNLPRSRPGTAQREARRPRASRPAPEAGALPSPTTDPVGDALRMVGGLAAGGARVAQGVAREVLRRMPRP